MTNNYTVRRWYAIRTVIILDLAYTRKFSNPYNAPRICSRNVSFRYNNNTYLMRSFARKSTLYVQILWFLVFLLNRCKSLYKAFLFGYHHGHPAAVTHGTRVWSTRTYRNKTRARSTTPNYTNQRRESEFLEKTSS